MNRAPKNPLEVSYTDAQFYHMIGQDETVDVRQYEHDMLARLGEQANAWALTEQSYEIHANTALWLPRDTPEEGKVPIGVFYNLPLTARFDGFGVVRIPLQQGAQLWRMLCLEFEDVLLQPDGDRLPETQMLRVPVLEVGKIACLGFGGAK